MSVFFTDRIKQGRRFEVILLYVFMVANHANKYQTDLFFVRHPLPGFKLGTPTTIRTKYWCSRPLGYGPAKVFLTQLGNLKHTGRVCFLICKTVFWPLFKIIFLINRSQLSFNIPVWNNWINRIGIPVSCFTHPCQQCESIHRTAT